jgi:hypothetical protein
MTCRPMSHVGLTVSILLILYFFAAFGLAMFNTGIQSLAGPFRPIR